MREFVIGVDEAGRGPLAGSVAVGLVAVAKRFDVLTEFPGVRDSKKLSENKREKIYELLVKRALRGDLRFSVQFSDHTYIDAVGIVAAVRRAVETGLRVLAPDPRGARVLLDGSLNAPDSYAQETIIGGDDTVPLISLASVAAKVERDRLMCLMALEFPDYGFEQHKGYGTFLHREAIRRHGLSPVHRRTYCRAQAAIA